jgi:SAM-dependent methyltransferase
MPPVPAVPEIQSYLSRFNFFDRYVTGRHEGDVYVATHARRFQETLRHLPELPPQPRVLELGALPYSMTILLRRYLSAAVDTVSFYEVASADAPRHVLESPDGSERYEFEYRSLNVERDPFPFDDDQYDLVLCCEILEHLLIHPSHMFYEAHRVLKPGAAMFVSTPNVLRTANLQALAAGRNIYDAYHGNGIYGRHNREYTPDEVATLLESCGFSVALNATVDVYDSTPPGSAPGREDTIMTIGRATGERRMAAPPGLYVLLDEYRNVIRRAIVMGVDETGHLGRGWYDLEREQGQGSRWTGPRAGFYLNGPDATVLGFALQAHHPDIREQPLNVLVRAGGRSLGAMQITDWAWHDVELPVGSGTLTRDTEITIEVSRTWRPGDAGGTDPRELGVRIRRCWCR